MILLAHDYMRIMPQITLQSIQVSTSLLRKIYAKNIVEAPPFDFRKKNFILRYYGWLVHWGLVQLLQFVSPAHKIGNCSYWRSEMKSYVGTLSSTCSSTLNRRSARAYREPGPRSSEKSFAGPSALLPRTQHVGFVSHQGSTIAHPKNQTASEFSAISWDPWCGISKWSLEVLGKGHHRRSEPHEWAKCEASHCGRLKLVEEIQWKLQWGLRLLGVGERALSEGSSLRLCLVWWSRTLWTR